MDVEKFHPTYMYFRPPLIHVTNKKASPWSLQFSLSFPLFGTIYPPCPVNISIFSHLVKWELLLTHIWYFYLCSFKSASAGLILILGLFSTNYIKWSSVTHNQWKAVVTSQLEFWHNSTYMRASDDYVNMFGVQWLLYRCLYIYLIFNPLPPLPFVTSHGESWPCSKFSSYVASFWLFQS